MLPLGAVPHGAHTRPWSRLLLSRYFRSPVAALATDVKNNNSLEEEINDVFQDC